MDTGSKTLAQLSEENKEKNYVTLEVGSKISGYTKDYLERLCRLNKVEYRLWSNGSHVIELESLLRETHTILLSYEGITFVDKKELTDPIPQLVPEILSTLTNSPVPLPAPILSNNENVEDNVARVPHYSGDSATRSQFAFVGRAVESDALHPEEKNNEINTELTTQKKQVTVSTPTIEVVPQKNAKDVEVKEADAVPVIAFNMDAIKESKPLASELSAAIKTPARIPIVADNSVRDDWDAQLLGESDSVKLEPVPRHIPIQSSDKISDPASHPLHIPIFPIKEKEPALVSESVPAAKVESVEVTQISSAQVSESNNTPAQKIIVFSDHGKTELPTPELPQTTPSAAIGKPAPSSLMSPQEIEVDKRPSRLPMKNEEHHLTPYEMHPLMKHTGFNVVFGLMLFATTFLAVGGTILSNVNGGIPTTQFVAGVGAAGGVPSQVKEKPAAALGTESQDSATRAQEAMLPFSSDIVATSGEKENSIIVRPVLENGLGESYEYIIIRQKK